jgi:uracil-DNA glycosylase
MKITCIIKDDDEVEDVDWLDETHNFEQYSIIEQARLFPPAGWKDVFERGDRDLESISKTLEPRGIYYPHPKYLFHIFRICPLSSVKVVIVGQDPYPDENDAWGVSFSTPPGGKIRPSLRMIYEELEREYEDFFPPEDGCLLPWVEQGVFLLNYCLTYHPDQKLKPSEMNVYMKFMRHVIAAIKAKNPHVVFVLWGKKAEVLDSLLKGVKVIKGPHPSPIGGRGFLGCGHFSEINDYLVAKGQVPIDWRI